MTETSSKMRQNRLSKIFNYVCAVDFKQTYARTSVTSKFLIEKAPRATSFC